MEEQNLINQKESIKLTKNSRGYNWEIKLIEDKMNKDVVERFKFLDGELKKEFEKEVKEE